MSYNNNIDGMNTMLGAIVQQNGGTLTVTRENLEAFRKAESEGFVVDGNPAEDDSTFTFVLRQLTDKEKEEQEAYDALIALLTGAITSE